jgi:hypothetical protein
VVVLHCGVSLLHAATTLVRCYELIVLVGDIVTGPSINVTEFHHRCLSSAAISRHGESGQVLKSQEGSIHLCADAHQMLYLLCWGCPWLAAGRSCLSVIGNYWRSDLPLQDAEDTAGTPKLRKLLVAGRDDHRHKSTGRNHTICPEIPRITAAGQKPNDWKRSLSSQSNPFVDSD